ncbi:hypothetical protein EHR01_01605 [Leptospira mtsangambouensis]|uniref:Lipoprotein n=1 Tax=Leptospira mtsangambouensis TaxID=2484912 RepID=A0ABY2P246_9LEPT|nr:hypothetical protein [Leptospira mtsangambouensis]TGM81521.1 hypothetical protein EHR01_01605 [Leptospira mtsangambouensis]
MNIESIFSTRFLFFTLKKIVPIYFCILTLYTCGERSDEVKADPLVQLFMIDFASKYYSNSCQHPALTLKKGEKYQIKLKLGEETWFQFSPEGTTPHANTPSPTSNYSFFIQKTQETQVIWITSNSCLTSTSYTYERTPISSIQTEIKFELWNSDFNNYKNPPPSKNGYYVKFISGNPDITIRFE